MQIRSAPAPVTYRVRARYNNPDRKTRTSACPHKWGEHSRVTEVNHPHAQSPHHANIVAAVGWWGRGGAQARKQLAPHTNRNTIQPHYPGYRIRSFTEQPIQGMSTRSQSPAPPSNPTPVCPPIIPNS